MRFSPSGDVVAASSYDGRIRLFTPSLERPELPLVQTLRHGGTANVYALAFTRDGDRLVIIGSARGEPWLDERVVVVARGQHQLAPGKGARPDDNRGLARQAEDDDVPRSGALPSRRPAKSGISPIGEEYLL